MLRKRTRSHQKDQHMGQLTSDVASESHFHSDFLGHKHKNNSFFNVPGLFVGLNHPKGSESDSVRSPTSPLDFRLFSNFGNPFRSPRSYHEGHHKIWDGNNKVGLGIIDSLDDEVKQSGKLLRASESKNILFGPQMRIKILKSPMHTSSLDEPKSLPKNIGIFPYNNARPSILQKKGSSDVLFEIGDVTPEPEPSFRPLSLDSVRSGSRFSRLARSNPYLGSKSSFVCENGNDLVTSTVKIDGGSKMSNLADAEQHSVQASVDSGSGLIGTMPPSEIELSEDYTCVRIHGPNPKVTHIFGDCILKCHNNEIANFGKNNGGIILPQAAECSNAPMLYPSNDFLRLCYSCKKKLDGEDIYMYRGEKAFCSWNCRLQEILIDEKMEESKETNHNNSNFKEIARPSNCVEHSKPSLFISA